MKFTKYIKLILEQEEEVPKYLTTKRKGEYVIAGDKNKAINKAIEEKKMISFMYNGPRKPTKDFDGKMMDSVKPGKRQKVFPVALGLSKKNKMIVRCWIEPPNPSKKGFAKKSAKDIPNWRTFIVGRMSDLRILEDNFDISKLSGYNPSGDKSMRVVYKQAKLGNVAAPKVKPKPAPLKPTPTPKPQPPKPSPTPKPEPPKPSPTAKPEIKPLPTPKPEKKPETPKPSPEPEKKKLPEIKPKEKPSKEPSKKEEDEMEPLMGLSEQIKRIKSLMS